MVESADTFTLQATDRRCAISIERSVFVKLPKPIVESNSFPVSDCRQKQHGLFAAFVALSINVWSDLGVQ